MRSTPLNQNDPPSSLSASCTQGLKETNSPTMGKIFSQLWIACLLLTHHFIWSSASLTILWDNKAYITELLTKLNEIQYIKGVVHCLHLIDGYLSSSSYSPHLWKWFSFQIETGMSSHLFCKINFFKSQL